MLTPKGFIDDRIVALMDEEDLIIKLSEANTPRERYAMVKDRVGVSFEEFVEQVTLGKSLFKEMETGELTEDDLDMVAGGKGQANCLSQQAHAVLIYSYKKL